MVSSARNAPSRTVVRDGMSRTVDASTSLPIFAPSIRSHTGVSIEAYSGYSQFRAASMIRSLHQACHAILECTGWNPGARRNDRTRIATRVNRANRAKASRAPGIDHSAVRRASSAGPSASRAPHTTRTSPAAIATTGIPPSTSADTW